MRHKKEVFSNGTNHRRLFVPSSLRYATLAANVLKSEATLTDEILDLHDRLIGSFFAKAKHKYERIFTEAAPALHETIQLYARVGTAIVEAKETTGRSLRGD